MRWMPVVILGWRWCSSWGRCRRRRRRRCGRRWTRMSRRTGCDRGSSAAVRGPGRGGGVAVVAAGGLGVPVATTRVGRLVRGAGVGRGVGGGGGRVAGGVVAGDAGHGLLLVG